MPGIVLVLASAFVQAEEGDSWTNHAGHILKASPQSIHGQTVTFMQGSNGVTVDYPLSLFPPQEQERLRACLKVTSIPEGLQSAYEFSLRSIKRSRLMFEHGSITKEAHQQTRETTLSAFRKQAAPFIAGGKLSQERLELIVVEMGAVQ